MATEHTFDAVAFREQFPAFSSATKYPDALLSRYFTSATCFIWPIDWKYLHGNCLQLALNLMTAHLAQIGANINQGNTSTGILTSASIDKVSVGLQAPATKNGWQAWLATTPWGMELWALISAKRPRVLVAGGSPERAAFRGVGGVFGGGRRWLR